MRRGVGTVLACAALAGLLTGCPATIVRNASPGATLVATPTGQSPPPAGADLFGQIKFEDKTKFTNPPGDPAGNGDDLLAATVNVAMQRDPATGGFVDVGSSFGAIASSSREKEIGDPSCHGVSKANSEVHDQAFRAPPTSPDDPGSTISVVYDPNTHAFTLLVNVFYSLTSFSNACMSGKDITETHWAGGPLGCGAFGLSGVITVNPAGPDQIDMACHVLASNVIGSNKQGGVTVTGILTIRD
jgi:hypothetical protein